MTDEHISMLIARKLAGEASAEEAKELQEYLEQHPEEQYFFGMLSGFWKQQPDIPDLEDLHSDEHFRHIINLAGNTAPKEEQDAAVFFGGVEDAIPPRRRLFPYLAAAITISILLLTGFLYWKSSKEPALSLSEVKSNEIIARPGARTHFLLPDGSQVWLNSESSIKYNGTFNDSMREIELDGEGFFDVVKDASRPFIVHTSAGIDIKVLGTAFNVKAYPNDPVLEATLLRGLIEVINKKQPDAPKILLRPHEKMVFKKEADAIITNIANRYNKNIDTPSISISLLEKNLPDSSIKETSWVYNKLLFDGENFRELAAKMERWFYVKINFSNEEVAGYRFRGVFENETIEQALKALQLTAPFTYKITNNEVEISK